MIEKGDTIKVSKGKSGKVISVVNIHNIQVMFSDGSIIFYCFEPECKHYDGNKVLLIPN